MSLIAKSGNSMLMICFDLDKTVLPDMAILGIPTCPIGLFHDIFDYLFVTQKGQKHQIFE